MALIQDKGAVTEFYYNNKNLITGTAAVFYLQLRDKEGNSRIVSAFDASDISQKDWCIYSGFPVDITVKTKFVQSEQETEWKIEISNNTDMAIEYVDYPCFAFDKLKKEGGGGEILVSYNEGALIDSAQTRVWTDFRHQPIEYPSLGCYFMFPYMLSMQFMAYLSENGGIYLGAHDSKRGPKSFDFYEIENGINMFVKNYTGGDYGEDFVLPYPIITKTFDGTWEDAAEIYRLWIASSLPDHALKITENPKLPQWYKEPLLIVAYPVRGIHDMDKMDPNALFPYINGLDTIEKIANETKSRIMVLLMHWEGTAPWAPPYVWPPYGGEDALKEYIDALHSQGHLLGVYCSGFGWTLQSNLIEDYRCSVTDPESSMCTSPQGKVELSRICTGQRSGYDICPASDAGKKILKDAYSPLFNSGVDYAQILDQNHGGSQYFCYSSTHGHPPMPGEWMTQNMGALLDDWNRLAPNMLLGCESASAEPYISRLLFNDNRFELNYMIGKPVPLYSYVFHEYLRNFMGNQVSCPFSNEDDTLYFRIAYSFVAGDAPAVTLSPDGSILPFWGCRDFTNLPNKEKVLTFIKNLLDFHQKKALPFLSYGKMIKSLPVNCDHKSFVARTGNVYHCPAIFTSAWSWEHRNAQIFVNHTDTPTEVKFKEETITVPPLNAAIIEF